MHLNIYLQICESTEFIATKFEPKPWQVEPKPWQVEPKPWQVEPKP